MKKSFFALALLFVTSSLFITSCSPKPEPAKQSTIDKILTQKTLVVGTTGVQFPFSFKGEDGKLQGVDINIANYLAKELNVAIKYEIMDFEQLIPAVESGKVDIVFSGVSMTPMRNTRVAFPGVYFKSGKSILTKSKKISLGDAEDVSKKEVTLVTTKSTTSEVFARAKYPNATIVLVDSNPEAIALLAEDKVDGFLADYELCEMIAFSYEDSFLYYKNLSKSTEKEFLSPVVAADDYLFINLISNYIQKVNAFDKSDAVDQIWYDYSK